MQPLRSEPPDPARAPEWAAEIPAEQWQAYRSVLVSAREAGLAFALGGAFGTAVYTGHWRNTKDLDLYVLPRDHERMVAAVLKTGFKDLYDQSAYDRRWIFRAVQGDIIVDVIWAMANQKADVDSLWLTRGPEVTVRGERLRVVPAEELTWAKLYVLQRDRCDWPDVLNILEHYGRQMAWSHLLQRLGEDARLLAGALSIFAWLTPDAARRLPAWLWEALHLTAPASSAAGQSSQRANLLDARDWFFSE